MSLIKYIKLKIDLNFYDKNIISEIFVCVHDILTINSTELSIKYYK